MYNNFVNEVRLLNSKGKNLRFLHNLYQALGLATTVTGGVAVFVATWAAAPLSVGVVMYAASVLSEKKRTGKLSPLPFSSEDVANTASQSLEGASLASLPVRDTHYLSLEDKALLYLVSEQGPRLSQLADGMDSQQFDYVVTRLVERLMQHDGFLNNPNGIESARVRAGEIPVDYYFQDALNYLPHEAKKLIPAGMMGEAAIAERAPRAIAQPMRPVGEPFQNAHPGIDNATRLGAVDVEASPVMQSALDILVNNAAISRAIYGGQRTGKSYLCAVASRQRHQAKDTTTFFVNLNAFDQEDGYYWQHSEDSVVVNVHAMNKERAKVAVQSAIDVVSRFQHTPNSLLIVDEWSSCGSKTMGHQALLEEFTQAVASVNNAISPTAIKRKQAIWLLTPAIVATEMTQAAKTIKSMQPLIVAIAPGHDVFYDGARLTFDSILHQQVSQNYTGQIADAPPSFSEPRMVQVDKAWIAVGVTGHELDQVKARGAPRPQRELPKPQILTERSSWQSFRQGIATEYPGMPELMDWMATREDPCGDRDITRVTAVREAIKKNGADKPVSEVIRDYLSTLVTANLVAQNGDSFLGLPHE